VVSALLWAAGWPSPPGPAPAGPASPPPSAATTAFLTGWRAHLSSSWSVDQVVERRADSGATLSFAVHEAQRPPDSVRVGLGTVSARQGSTQLACGPTRGSQTVCRRLPAPTTWAATVDSQLAALAALVEGPSAVYRVTTDRAGCFMLALVVPPAQVPVSLERAATYCLDPASGALLSARIQRDGATDVTTTTAHHAPAVDADLALPAGVVIG